VAFYFALRAAVRGRYLIAFKVRLADLITCGESAWKAGFGHMIARHHLDFVICDHRSTDILLAIELDDRSHGLASRKRRDAFVNEALATAGIPLLRFQAAARYEVQMIAQTLEKVLSRPAG
jgi:very-short-patch-repair endonuclease